MDNCRSASQEWSEPAIVGPAKFDQPGETLLKGSRELECPRCPSAVVLGVVPYQKGERGIINACLMMGVKSPQPAGCLRHRARLAPGPLRTDVAQAPEAVNVFEKKRRFTGLRIRVCAQALGSESGQWPQHPPIDLRLVRDVAAVPERIVTLSASVLDEHSPNATIGQLAGHDLVREGVHEAGKISFEHPYRASFSGGHVKARRQPLC